MLDVGFFELLLIAVVALVVIGPEKLPEVAKTVGLWFGKIRAMMTSVQSEIQDELKKHEDQINRDLAIDELKKTRDSVTGQINEEMRDLSQSATIKTGGDPDPSPEAVQAELAKIQADNQANAAANGEASQSGPAVENHAEKPADTTADPASTDNRKQ